MDIVLGGLAAAATLAAAFLGWRWQTCARAAAVLRARVAELEADTSTASAARARRWLEHLAWVMAVQARSPSQRALDDLLALRSTRVEVLDVGERHLLDGAVASTEHALRLHDALQTWARTPTVAADPAPMDARAALDKAVVELDADGNATLDVHGTPSVVADEQLLTDVLLAVLDNCVRYRWPGAPVHIEIDAGEATDGTAVLLVSDDGLGVDVDAQDHLFLPFTRGNGASAMPGVGLGLATVERAMEAMGGRARFVPHEGRGSTLALAFPAA